MHLRRTRRQRRGETMRDERIDLAQAAQDGGDEQTRKRPVANRELRQFARLVDGVVQWPAAAAGPNRAGRSQRRGRKELGAVFSKVLSAISSGDRRLGETPTRAKGSPVSYVLTLPLRLTESGRCAPAPDRRVAADALWFPI